MRVVSIIFFLFFALAKAASSSSKCQQLTKMANQGGSIRLDSASFNNLIVDKPRNYSVVVTLTAMGAEFGCSVCRCV
jgi:hypothetical protein